MARRTARADDAYPVHVLPIGVHMDDDQQDDMTDHADRMVPTLSVGHAIRHDHMQRIVPDRLRQ